MYHVLSAHIRSRFKCLTLFLTCLVMLPLAAASALDAGDVKNLIRNQVPEQAIINMVQSDGSIYITFEEADEFRALGASEDLITQLRPIATTTTDTTATTKPTPPIVVTGSAPVVTQSVQQPTAVTDVMPADGMPITVVPIVSSSGYPPRYDKEGWLSISNRDWIPYYINVNVGDKRLFISKAPNGGMLVQSGESVVINLRKETYKMYGDSGKSLSIKIRENETTTLSLNPFGVFGNSGLTGVATDRDRVRSEILFNNYMPPPATVVVQEPPVIVIPEPRPPVYYPYYGRPYRHYRGGDGVYFRYYR